MESFLDTLHRCGFTDAGCVGAYRSFSSFLLGHLLLEVSGQGADVGPVEQADPDDEHRRPQWVPAAEKPGSRNVPGPFRRRIRRSPGTLLGRIDLLSTTGPAGWDSMTRTYPDPLPRPGPPSRVGGFGRASSGKNLITTGSPAPDTHPTERTTS
jgi:hypothetical protein